MCLWAPLESPSCLTIPSLAVSHGCWPPMHSSRATLQPPGQERDTDRRVRMVHTYTCNAKQISSLSPQLPFISHRKKPFPKSKPLEQRSTISMPRLPPPRHFKTTATTGKLNPNPAADNPSSSQPHRARTQAVPTAQNPAEVCSGPNPTGKGCGTLIPAAKASGLGNSHLPEIIILFYSLCESNTPGLDSCSPNTSV